MAKANTDIIAALNGEGDALPPAVDPLPPEPASRESQLTVPEPPKPTAIQAADAQHATKVGGKGYRVRTKGEYFAPGPDGKGKIKKPYTAEFTLPQLTGALSVIKNKLLAPTLRKKYPDFAADRTCYIIDAVPLNPATPKSNNLAYMDREQLEEYVRQSQPPIPLDPSPANYPLVEHLREAIIDYIQTPDGFKDREAARQQKRAELRELAELNPGVELEA